MWDTTNTENDKKRLTSNLKVCIRINLSGAATVRHLESMKFCRINYDLVHDSDFLVESVIVVVIAAAVKSNGMK